MYNSQHSKRPETDRVQATSEQKPTNPKQQSTIHMSNLTRIPPYTQLAWGNQPPPWLRPPVQRQEAGEKESLQEGDTLPMQRKENMTGLPDALKAGVESLSGMAMDDVHVHYHSPAPAQVQALAYTQGTEIHVGPGQEKHLPHETWHVVQQKQGRVKPTIQLQGRSINDDVALEGEATVMGERATSGSSAELSNDANTDTNHSIAAEGLVQRYVGFDHHNLLAPFFRGVYPTGKMIRPAWIGTVTFLPTAAGQSLNHIIGFHHIAESLVNLINDIYTTASAGTVGMLASPAKTAAAAAAAAVPIAHLIATTNSLFPNGNAYPEYALMTQTRTFLVNTITGVANFAVPTAAEIANLRLHAFNLEQYLNSSPDNIRVGNASLNSSIQEHIDADYGPIVTLPGAGAAIAGLPAPVPAGWAANWGGVYPAPGVANLLPGDRLYTLTPASNRIVYNFITTHGHQYLSRDITIVRNNDPNNPIHPMHNIAFNAPLSSTGVPVAPAGPAGAGIPVIVFDPLGAALPYRFG